eukprot:6366104-Prymnesium_polylepis.1
MAKGTLHHRQRAGRLDMHGSASGVTGRGRRFARGELHVGQRLSAQGGCEHQSVGCTCNTNRHSNLSGGTAVADESSCIAPPTAAPDEADALQLTTVPPLYTRIDAGFKRTPPPAATLPPFWRWMVFRHRKAPLLTRKMRDRC